MPRGVLALALFAAILALYVQQTSAESSELQREKDKQVSVFEGERVDFGEQLHHITKRGISREKRNRRNVIRKRRNKRLCPGFFCKLASCRAVRGHWRKRCLRCRVRYCQGGDVLPA